MFLHPGATAMKDVDSALQKRCAVWHSLGEELNI